MSTIAANTRQCWRVTRARRRTVAMRVSVAEVDEYASRIWEKVSWEAPDRCQLSSKRTGIQSLPSNDDERTWHGAQRPHCSRNAEDACRDLYLEQDDDQPLPGDGTEVDAVCARRLEDLVVVTIANDALSNARIACLTLSGIDDLRRRLFLVHVTDEGRHCRVADVRTRRSQVNGETVFWQTSKWTRLVRCFGERVNVPCRRIIYRRPRAGPTMIPATVPKGRMCGRLDSWRTHSRSVGTRVRPTSTWCSYLVIFATASLLRPSTIQRGEGGTTQLASDAGKPQHGFVVDGSSPLQSPWPGTGSPLRNTCGQSEDVGRFDVPRRGRSLEDSHVVADQFNGTDRVTSTSLPRPDVYLTLTISPTPSFTRWVPCRLLGKRSI